METTELYEVTITWYKDIVLVIDNEGRTHIWHRNDENQAGPLDVFLGSARPGMKPEECIDVLRIKEVFDYYYKKYNK